MRARSENWKNRKTAYHGTLDLKSGKNLKRLWKKPITLDK